MDYTPNSHAYKEKQKQAAAEEKKFQPVVSGTAEAKKKSGVSKIASVFISEDVSNVKDYIVQDIVVPTIKKGILGAIDMILNGGNGAYSERRSQAPKISYRTFYDDPYDRRRREERPRTPTRFDSETITYTTRGDAEAVLDQMFDAVKRYGLVTVGDMYDLSRLEPPHTSNKYGWYSLRGAKTIRVPGGFVIDLPPAEPID